MDSGFSDRVAVAGVLLELVRARLARSGSSKTSRTALHASVPVGERASVRRGLAALIDHRVLAMSGEDIGFTVKGRLVLARVLPRRGRTPLAVQHDDTSSAVLSSVLAGIDLDERFDPKGSVEEVQSLPARLEVARSLRRSSFPTKWLTGATCLLAIAAAWALR